MSAAEKALTNLHTMADYSALAMLTDGSNRLNGTLQTVEGVSCPGGYQLESLIVLVTANFAFRHMAPRSQYINVHDVTRPSERHRHC